ncbi:uncharacterized protein LOC144449049 [Glandiceps talaboti]
MSSQIVTYDGHLQEIEIPTARRPSGTTENVEVVESNEGDRDRTLKLCVPMFPMCFAATCLIFNIVIPGLGSMLAGLGALFCCNKTSCGLRVAHFCFNFWCGVFQLAFAILIVGWIWSVLWGLMYVGFALDDDEKDDQRSSRQRRHNPRAQRAVVYPYPLGVSPPPPPGSPPPAFLDRPCTPPPSYNEAMQEQPPTEEAIVAVQNRYGQPLVVAVPQSQPIYMENSAQTPNQCRSSQHQQLQPPVDYHTPGQVPT